MPGEGSDPFPALPPGSARAGLQLAQDPSGSRSDRCAKEGEPAGRAAAPLEVTALPGSLRCLQLPPSVWGQPTCAGCGCSAGMAHCPF